MISMTFLSTGYLSFKTFFFANALRGVEFYKQLKQLFKNIKSVLIEFRILQ